MAQCLRDIRIKCLSAIPLDFSSWSQNGCYGSGYCIQVHGRKKGERKKRSKTPASSPLIKKTRLFPSTPPPSLPQPYFYLCLICPNWVMWPFLMARMIRKNENSIVMIGLHRFWSTAYVGAHCYYVNVRKKEGGGYWTTYLNSGIRFGHCRIRSWTHEHGGQGPSRKRWQRSRKTQSM